VVRRFDRSGPVYRITGAQTSLATDQRARTRRYLMSMSIRTVCFLCAIVAHGPLRWVLVVGAVVLPYVAVVGANAGRERDSSRLPDVLPQAAQTGGAPVRGLGSGTTVNGSGEVSGEPG
jgi:Flp pilus assembly protein TadB